MPPWKTPLPPRVADTGGVADTARLKGPDPAPPLPFATRASSDRRSLAALLSLLICGACGPVATGGPCRDVVPPVALPDGMSETSGVAVSLDHPGIFWIHNDAGDRLTAVDSSGRERATVVVPFSAIDWEDLALASCPRGGSCLYAADVGDNYEEHAAIRLYRFAEPDLDDSRVTVVDTFPMRLPDGSRDIESMLLLRGERPLFVTKGRNHPQTVYRYPGPLTRDTVTLEPIQELSAGPRILPRQITGGATSPLSDLVALRTYQSVQFYRVESDTLVPVQGGLVNLRTLNERQGEGVALGPDGQLVLTSEGGAGGGAGSLAVLGCTVEG